MDNNGALNLVQPSQFDSHTDFMKLQLSLQTTPYSLCRCRVLLKLQTVTGLKCHTVNESKTEV